MTVPQIIFWIGTLDAVAIMALGVVSAALLIAGKEAEIFYNRILPACGVLIGASFAAGLVILMVQMMLAGKWW